MHSLCKNENIPMWGRHHCRITKEITFVEGTNVINGHKCNKVTSVTKIGHNCNKITSVIRFGHKCNKVKSALNFGHCYNKAEQQLSLNLDDVISHGTFFQPFYTLFSAKRCNGELILEKRMKTPGW